MNNEPLSLYTLLPQFANSPRFVGFVGIHDTAHFIQFVLIVLMQIFMAVDILLLIDRGSWQGVGIATIGDGRELPLSIDIDHSQISNL